MDQLTLRLEAARIAAQVEGVTTRNYIAMTQRIEEYIRGKASLPERFDEEEALRTTIHQAMMEMTGANEAIRKLEEYDRQFYNKYKDLAPSKQDDTGSRPPVLENTFKDIYRTEGRIHAPETTYASMKMHHPESEAQPPSSGSNCSPPLEDLYVFGDGLALRRPKPGRPAHAVDRQHDPSFASSLMKACTDYPVISRELSEAARHRQELYHDLGLAPEPFCDRHRHTECPTAQETVYLAPGGMPSSEAESIYLQENGDKVE